MFEVPDKTAAETLATPSTDNKTKKFKLVMETPHQFDTSGGAASRASLNQSTDEQGNRNSILPGSARPSKEPAKFDTKERSKKSQEKKAPAKKEMTAVERLQEQTKQIQETGLKKGATSTRQNYVRLNANGYKPRLRGEQFKSKIMAKKTNSVRAKARFAKKMKIEQAQQWSQVNAYGGLAKVGLDFED